MENDNDRMPPDEETGSLAEPVIPIEGFVGYRDRLAADVDGKIGEMVLSYANAQPPEIREKLETDVDTFIGVWDKFAAAFPPPAPVAPPEPPPPPKDLRVPPWREAQIEREASARTTRLDSTFSIGPGVMPEHNTGGRAEARRFNKEVESIRQRVKGGDQDAEYDLALKLFGDASRWKPSHGPERG